MITPSSSSQDSDSARPARAATIWRRPIVIVLFVLVMVLVQVVLRFAIPPWEETAAITPDSTPTLESPTVAIEVPPISPNAGEYQMMQASPAAKPPQEMTILAPSEFAPLPQVPIVAIPPDGNYLAGSVSTTTAGVNLTPGIINLEGGRSIGAFDPQSQRHALERRIAELETEIARNREEVTRLGYGIGTFNAAGDAAKSAGERSNDSTKAGLAPFVELGARLFAGAVDEKRQAAQAKLDENSRTLQALRDELAAIGR